MDSSPSGDGSDSINLGVASASEASENFASKERLNLSGHLFDLKKMIQGYRFDWGHKFRTNEIEDELMESNVNLGCLQINLRHSLAVKDVLVKNFVCKKQSVPHTGAISERRQD